MQPSGANSGMQQSAQPQAKRVLHWMHREYVLLWMKPANQDHFCLVFLGSWIAESERISRMRTHREDQSGALLGPPKSHGSRRLLRATWCPRPATAQKPRVRKCLQPNYAPWLRPVLANRGGGGGAGERESPVTFSFPTRRRGLGFTTLGLSAALITFSEGWRVSLRLAPPPRALVLFRDCLGGCSSQVPCVTAPCCLLSSCPCCCCCWFGDRTRAQVTLPLPLLLSPCLSPPPSFCPPETSWRRPPA